MSFAWKTSLCALLFAGAAQSANGERVHLDPFTAIELAGPGSLTVQYAPDHAVRMVKGDLRDLEVSVRTNRGLRIRCRTEACRRSPPVMVVSVPEVEALAIQGNGSARIAGGFRPQSNLALAINGGGSLDARGFQARKIAAAVNGGGSILTGQAATLAATVNGGGTIIYSGAPRLASVVRGGGVIRRDGTPAR